MKWQNIKVFNIVTPFYSYQRIVKRYFRKPNNLGTKGAKTFV